MSEAPDDDLSLPEPSPPPPSPDGDGDGDGDGEATRTWSAGMTIWSAGAGEAGGESGFPLAFAHFSLSRRIGGGGGGTVYEAIQMERIYRTVALKLPRDASDRSAADRFRNEAQHLGERHDAGIVPVYESGLEPNSGCPYLSMALIGGGALSGIIAARRRAVAGDAREPDPVIARLGGREYLRWMAEVVRDVARALGRCHTERRLIHRDLKPGNILIEWHPSRQHLLTDFGLARELPPGCDEDRDGPLGTWQYMAPERLRARVGEPVDGFRADVYGLGAVLFEGVTLRQPRPSPSGGRAERPSDPEVWATVPVPPAREVAPGLPADLAAIVDQAMHREPTRRYAGADQLAADLDRWLAGLEVEARPRPPWRRAWDRMAARPRRLALAAGMVLILVAIAIGLGVARARDRARAEVLQNGIRSALSRDAAWEAADLAMELGRLAPGRSQTPVLLNESIRAYLERGQEQSIRNFVSQGLTLLDHLPRLPLDATDRKAREGDLRTMLGVSDLLVITEPAGAPVRIYRVDVVGRPLLSFAYRAFRGGSAERPHRVRDLPTDDYWIVAELPGGGPWVERAYLHSPPFRGNLPVEEPLVTLRLHTEAEASGAPVPMRKFDGGSFQMGIALDPRDGLNMARNSPIHPRHVPSFWLDRHEVTNAQFETYLKAIGADSGPLAEQIRRNQVDRKADWPRLPVVNLTSQQMADYAAWRGCRLPTEAELEFAATHLFPDARRRQAAYKDPRGLRLHPVSSLVADRSDDTPPVAGLCSNASEVTQLKFHYYPGYAGPRDAAVERHFAHGQVVRAGIVVTDGPEPYPLGHDLRAFLVPKTHSPLVGFRCARSLGPVDRAGTGPLP